MTTTAYLRISTDKQDERSQREQITAYANAKGITVNEWVLDAESGATPWDKRQLGQIFTYAGNHDTIIVSEISRIARSTVGVLTFLQRCAERQLYVIAVRNGLALDESLQSKITVTILALCAEIERDLLRERTKAALAARRQAGQHLGRPFGARSASKLEKHAPEIARCMEARVSLRAIARMLDCAPATLSAYLEKQSQKTTNQPEPTT